MTLLEPIGTVFPSSGPGTLPGKASFRASAQEEAL
jgi:hypothetical protein